jgi:hypothetical protein
MAVFGRNLFKMWSFQSPDDGLSVSVIDQGTATGSLALGFVSMDGIMASANRIRSSARFDASGLQSNVELEVEDERGRMIRARMPVMHSCVGWGATSDFWGVEGVGDFEVEGRGRVPGLSSYFWPSRITPEALAAGRCT